jgi:hypothetical protein
MRTLLYCIAGIVAGYLVGAALGVVLISNFSPNTHDKSVEIATTAALVTGPLGAVIGLIAAAIGGRRG